MTTSERDAAWREYALQLGRLNVTGESLETAEIDFKAGFDAARKVLTGRENGTPGSSRASRVESARSGKLGPTSHRRRAG
jgi:hypothetical protein